MLQPTDCIAADFTSRWYKKWQSAMGLPAAKHPKFWELAALAEALKSRGCLAPGKTGLGMGVGQEQLVSLFAGLGASIVATDQPVTEEARENWGNGQLASGLDDLFYPDIVSEEVFKEHVTYEPYDMNTFNGDFVGKFDFVWHDCVIGHLGSLEKAADQLKKSTQYLKDGGWLVLTTELNISSLNETISEESETVFWRLSDLEALSNEMLEVGMVAEPLMLRLGDSKHDTRINYNHGHSQQASDKSILDNPDRSEIKIPVGGFALTQILLCFRKTAKKPWRASEKYAKATRRNTGALQKHALINPDLQDYYAHYDDIQYQDAQLMPERKELNLTMRAGETKRLSLRFLNRSEISLFDFSLFKPYNKPPLVVATFDPVNRVSVFAGEDWSSDNRPQLAFTPVKIHDQPDWNGHRARSAEWFEYAFHVKAPETPGTYTESFVLVFEGKAVVLSSVVTATVTVKDDVEADSPGVARREDGQGDGLERNSNVLSSGVSSAAGSKDVVSPAAMLDVLGWPKGGKEAAMAAAFLGWFEELARREFRHRVYMHAYEFAAFLRVYVGTHYPGYKLPGSIDANAVKYQDTYIQTGPPTAVPSVRTKIILIPSTPRVGGTVFSHLLGELTGWPRYTAADFDMIDLNGLSGPAIIHMHVMHDDFRVLKLGFPVQAVALARDPLDTLVSAFTFAQRNPSLVSWANLKVFDGLPTFSDKGADSPEFFDWATSKGAKNMLAVTPSWWNAADVRVRYEDFKSSPLETFKQVLTVIDPGRPYSDQFIQDTVDRIDREFLTNAANRHRWNGGSGYAQKAIPRDRVDIIRQTHRGVFEVLGY